MVNTFTNRSWCKGYHHRKWTQRSCCKAISIKTVIQPTHKHRRKQADSVVSCTNGFINFLTSAQSDTRRETQFLLCWPHQRAAHLVMFKISIERDPKNPTTSSTAQIQLSPQWQRTQLSASIVQSQLTFQNPQILRTISSGHDVMHTPVPFLVWGFIMTIVIVISFAHERKTVPNDYAPEHLTWIGQSPTKLNDKIWLTKND